MARQTRAMQNVGRAREGFRKEMKIQIGPKITIVKNIEGSLHPSKIPWRTTPNFPLLLKMIERMKTMTPTPTHIQ